MNLAATIPALFGLTVNPPLDLAIWGGAMPDVNRVVLFVTDGLGYKWLREMIAEDDAFAAVIADLNGGRAPLPMTSVAPSTTSVALPTLWTAAQPGLHGVTGRFMYMREVSTVVDVLFYRTATGMHGELESLFLEPEDFLPVATLSEQLSTLGVPTHLLLAKDLMGTGLSRMLHRGVAQRHTHIGYTDLWLRLSDVLQTTARKRCYISVYWEMVDSLSHAYGAHNDYLRAEIKNQMTALRDTLAKAAPRDGRTLVLIAADHGHYPIPQLVDIAADPDLFDAVRGMPSGDHRLSYWLLREGTKSRVTDVLDARYSHVLAWAEPQTVIDSGVFGAGLHPELLHRLGDLVVFPREGVRIGYRVTHRESRGSHHGGLSDWEMLAPLLWTTL
ncbi:alkaline phosphatase family protein [Escherichia coli]|uniref:alkaline phosphatase family protein n=4 Tax=Enterobacteriaceae TaxID=543 RepID=UPI00157535B5|nr:alkaline phosphatase family protein [Escherichia coli]